MGWRGLRSIAVGHVLLSWASGSLLQQCDTCSRLRGKFTMLPTVGRKRETPCARFSCFASWKYARKRVNDSVNLNHKSNTKRKRNSARVKMSFSYTDSFLQAE